MKFITLSLSLIYVNVTNNVNIDRKEILDKLNFLYF